MNTEEITVADFLVLARTHPVLDVRSPAEYLHAHIPGAVSFPLFTDDERRIVGTAYKQESREKAIKAGLKFFGPKMAQLVEKAEAICGLQQNDGSAIRQKTLLVHCWRGGMRSAGIAWLLQLYGFKIYTLHGGYKTFRKWVLSQFEKTYPLKVIGGYTGSGKTAVLQSLKKQGEDIIDLEALACHKGSAFGSLGEDQQPSQEMFENKLAMSLQNMTGKNQRIWIEDESRRIGDLNIPAAIYNCKLSMPFYFLDIPYEQRLECIMNGYSKFDIDSLASAITRIKKRLGPNETGKAIGYLQEGDTENAFRILLHYYDKQYAKSIVVWEKSGTLIHRINIADCDAAIKANILLESLEQKPVKLFHG